MKRRGHTTRPFKDDYKIRRQLFAIRICSPVTHCDGKPMNGVLMVKPLDLEVIDVMKPQFRMNITPRIPYRALLCCFQDMAALESTRGHPRWCFTLSGKRIHQSSTAWGLAKQRAGIEDFRFHDLTHTWASWHVQSGTSLPELMELGGWKSYEMVLRYAHLAPEKLSSVAGRIERQSSRLVEAAPRGEYVAKNATFSLRSLN